MFYSIVVSHNTFPAWRVEFQPYVQVVLHCYLSALQFRICRNTVVKQELYLILTYVVAMSNKHLELTKLVHQFIALSPMNSRWTKESSTFRRNCISERLYDHNKPQIQHKENYITKWGTFFIANLLEDPLLHTPHTCMK